MTDSINPLLAPLTADQVRVIELVASVYQDQRSWPPWQFIEQSMDKEGIDASSVISTLPRLGGPNRTNLEPSDPATIGSVVSDN
jgi:hypothetical protein